MTATKPTGSMSLDEIDIHSTAEYRRRGYPWEAWDLLRAEAPVFWSAHYHRSGADLQLRHLYWVSLFDNCEPISNRLPRLLVVIVHLPENIY